jgi:drug/metabolite transporter (DMT)-like permease
LGNLTFRTWLAFAAVSIFWGTTYLAIRIGVHEFPPLLFASVRNILAGFIFILYFKIIKKTPWPTWREFLKIALGGAFFILGANTLMTVSEVYITSGLAALLATFLPFYILLINFILGRVEKLNFMGYAGLVIGATGMVTIFYDSIEDLFNPLYSFGVVLIILSTISWAIGSVYMKDTKINIPSIFVSGIQMFSMGLIVFVISLFVEKYENIQVHPSHVYALIYLIIFGSLIGYGSFIYAVSKIPSTLFSMYAYINTTVAVILGVIVLNEKWTIFTFISVLLTILGVFLVSNGYQKQNLETK